MPKSLSWWSCVAEAAVNLARCFGYVIPIEVDALIGCGFGVGMRRKIGEK